MTFFKNKSKKQVKAPEPRQLADLVAANNELKSKAGDCQYLIYVYTQELAQLNQALLAVNQEAGLRKKLDAEAAEAKKETPNVTT